VAAEKKLMIRIGFNASALEKITGTKIHNIRNFVDTPKKPSTQHEIIKVAWQ